MPTTVFCKIIGKNVTGKKLVKQLEFTNDNPPWLALRTITAYMEKSSMEICTLYPIKVTVKLRGIHEVNSTTKKENAGASKAGQANAETKGA